MCVQNHSKSVGKHRGWNLRAPPVVQKKVGLHCPGWVAEPLFQTASVMWIKTRQCLWYVFKDHVGVCNVQSGEVSKSPQLRCGASC
jgi:hypothetical protein